MALIQDNSERPAVEFRLLGGFEILINGRPLPPLRSRHQQWLLALLILRHPRDASRDWLASTLWPDNEESQARFYLRKMLSSLRQTLGAEAARLLSPTSLTLRLDLEGAWADALAFDAALKDGREAEAAALYRGALLPDCQEEWVLPEREAREQAYLAALETLSARAAAAGQPATAVHWLRLLLVTDPYRESACCALMQALADCGDQAAMTQVYRDLRLRLRRDLNADPAPQTEALYLSLHTRQSPSVVLPPPAQAPAGPPRRLPVPLSDLIGREQEMEEVAGWLGRNRLVTLVGTGGVGKTRLSIAAAERVIGQFPDGVWFVDLAPLSDPTLMTPTLLRRLDVPEQPNRSPEATLEQALASRTLLLILDNCEHLLEASASLTHRLLSACPGLRVLATSREGLGLMGEHLLPVPPLSLPPEGRPNLEKAASALLEYEAVRLFVERGRQSNPTFRLTPGNAGQVVQVCERLDGIALAIEMAAARLKVLSVGQIAARLEDRFALLTGGSRAAMPRQRTLRATIDWSYDLLNEPEKALFARLSVFAGGCTLEAAEQICTGETSSGESLKAGEALDLLTSLVDKSLVIAEAQEQISRYRLLETVRQYALERLREQNGTEQVRRRHRDYFLKLAEETAPKLKGAEQGQWLEMLEAEHDNQRQAIAFCLEEPEGGETGLRFGAALGQLWEMRGHWSEGRERLSALLGRDGGAAGPPQRTTRAQALRHAGTLALRHGDLGAARARFEESLTLSRELGDRSGMANSLISLGNIARVQGDYAAAHTRLEESLALSRELGNRLGIANTLNNLGLVSLEQRDHAAARARFEESLLLYREIGEQRGVANTLNNLGLISRDQGDYGLAHARFEESLMLLQEIMDRWGIANALMNLACVALLRNDYPEARVRFEKSLTLSRELGSRLVVADTLNNLGVVFMYQRDYPEARVRFEESLTLSRELGNTLSAAHSLINLGMVAMDQGDYALARTRLGESLMLYRELGNRSGVAESLASLALLACKQQQVDVAVRLDGAATSLFEIIGVPRLPRDQEAYEKEMRPVRIALGDAAFDTAFEEGRAMTQEQAVAYALQDSASSS